MLILFGTLKGYENKLKWEQGILVEIKPIYYDEDNI